MSLVARERMGAARAHAECFCGLQRGRDGGPRAGGVGEHGAARHGRGCGADCGRRCIDRHRDHHQLGAPARRRERARRHVDRAAGQSRFRGAAVAVIAHAMPAARARKRQAERAADLAQAKNGDAARLAPRRPLVRGRRPRCSKIRPRRCRTRPRCSKIQPRCCRTRPRCRKIRPQRCRAVHVHRRQPRAFAHAAHGEQHAHQSNGRARHGHLGGAEQRHVGPAEQPRRVRGEVSGQIRRGGEDGAHDALRRERVGGDHRAQQPRGGFADRLGAVGGHGDGAADGSDGRCGGACPSFPHAARVPPC